MDDRLDTGLPCTRGATFVGWDMPVDESAPLMRGPHLGRHVVADEMARPRDGSR